MNTILKSLLLFILLAAAGFAQTADLAVKWYRLAASVLVIRSGLEISAFISH